MVIGHRVGEVTRVRTDRPRRPPNAFERDRSHGGRRSHLRATEPQRNLFPLHGNILPHSVSPHCSCEAREPGAHIDAQA